MNSRISSKGQVTVPVEARRKLGLSPGMAVEFLVRDGEVVLRKHTGGVHPVDAAFGSLTLDAPVDQLIDEMRGPAPWRRKARVRKPPKRKPRR